MTTIDMSGNVGVVTGAARGIGRAIAGALVSAGARVVMADIDGEALRREAKELSSVGEVTEVVADVTQDEDVAAIFAAATAQWGRIDLLVNNAAIIDTTPWPNVDMAEWTRVFRINVEGAARCSQQAVRLMAEQDPLPGLDTRGRVLFIGSGAADSATPDSPAYGASKAALRHLCQDMAERHRSDAIPCALIYPSTVQDGMWRSVPHARAKVRGTSVDDVIAERLAAIPSGRFQTAEEVAAVVLWAASRPGLQISGSVVWCGDHIQSL